MAMPGLRLFPIPARRVLAIIMLWPGWRVVFEDNIQCLIEPSREPGSRRLYLFSSDLVSASCSWITRYEDVLIVANTLAFVVVHERVLADGISTLVCEYRGMCS